MTVNRSLVTKTEKWFRGLKAHKILSGEMAEWSNAHPWKGCIWVTVSGVRIPLSPLSILKLGTSKYPLLLLNTAYFFLVNQKNNNKT